MTQLKHALREALSRFEKDVDDDTATHTPAPVPIPEPTPEPTPTTTPELTHTMTNTNATPFMPKKSSMTNTEYIFQMVKHNGSMTGVQVRDALMQAGYSWAKDASAYLNQLAKRGLLYVSVDHTDRGFMTTCYTCAKRRFSGHKSSRSTTTRAPAAVQQPVSVPSTPQSVEPSDTKRAPTFVVDFSTPAQDIVAHLTLRQARAVHDELAAIFGDKA